METEIMKIAASQGLWAVLFVSLLFYVLRWSEKREERILTNLDRITTELGSISLCMAQLKDDVKDLKGKVGA